MSKRCSHFIDCFAAVTGMGGSHWARFVSLVFSIPAALWALLGFFGTLGFLIHPYPGLNTPIFLCICLIVCLLMVCMPVFWAMLCRKSSTAV
jgi:hypothetical protein